MKKARKLTAVLLSLVMLLALVVPASAAENYSITIHNDKTGHTYEAYQIFAGTVSSDAATDGETEGPMLGDITWGSGVDGGALLAALKAADEEKYDACTTAADVAKALGTETATAADAAAFADIAAEHLTATVAGTADAPEGGNYVIEGLPAGYYLVKDSLQEDDNQTGQVLSDYIVQVLGNVTMDPKDSDIPTLEKKVAEEGKGNEGKYNQDGGYGTYYNDVADWNIGDSVPFKLIASMPDAAEIAAYDTYSYTFHDTLDPGLTLEQKAGEDQTTFAIYFVNTKNEDPRAEGFQYLDAAKYDVNIDAETNSFTIAIDDLKTLMVTTAGGQQIPATNYDYIVIFYDAVLNANAEIGLPGNENTAYLEFSNNPNGDGTGRTEDDKVIVFTYELDGTKVDGETQAALQNAKFVLLNGAKTEAAMVVDGKVKEWVKVATEAAADDVQMPETYEGWLELNQQHNGLILTSAEGGTFKIAGLDDGTYFLREIQAPNGYNLLEEDVQLVITATTANGQGWDGAANTALTALTIDVAGAGAVNGVLDTGVVNVTVRNNRGATLPETGGMGTTLFYIIGGLLVVGAGILLVVRIRMKAHNE
ncbi:isopeptide-forming domain-containing fimbrial protein [uncultured Phocaeicola sp.]|uniref:isopeptide-forming domain-containing fimbrial protein n=1 Tax=uncultured Phocaeicola sp. TaxID=990718 RepID=UPI0025FDB5D5|nr:isopeptide-forming domain-containing fimbrial protein [uncultured Phocaeicola sp.]